MPQSEFPNVVWNGQSDARKDLGSSAAPNSLDYLQIVMEVRAVQEYALKLGMNSTMMPDLTEKFKAADERLDELFLKLGDVTLPEDLRLKIEAIDTEIKLLDNRQPVADVTADIETLKGRVDGLKEMIDGFFTSSKESLQAARVALAADVNALKAKTSAQAADIAALKKIVMPPK